MEKCHKKISPLNRFPASAKERWDVAKPLERSGQAFAYHVREKGPSGRLGVLKTPHDGDIESRRIKRFLKEIDIVTKLDSPFVLPLIDWSRSGEFWHVTPLGVPLAEYWRGVRKEASAAETLDRSLQIVLDLQSGLSDVHATGAVHRDVKIGNVVVFNDRPALIDFGIARRPRVDEKLTDVDRPAANFAAPPNVQYNLLPDDQLGPWVDFYCLAILWALLLAKPGRFHHWRYHPLGKDPRAIYVRAVLATCSQQESCPKSAEEFRLLIDKFPWRPPATVEGHTLDVEKMLLAVGEARARHELQQAHSTEARAISVAVQQPWIKEMCIGFFGRMEELRVGKFPATIRPTSGEHRLSVETIEDLVAQTSLRDRAAVATYSIGLPEQQIDVAIAVGEIPRSSEFHHFWVQLDVGTCYTITVSQKKTGEFRTDIRSHPTLRTISEVSDNTPAGAMKRFAEILNDSRIWDLN